MHEPRDDEDPEAAPSGCCQVVEATDEMEGVADSPDGGVAEDDARTGAATFFHERVEERLSLALQLGPLREEPLRALERVDLSFDAAKELVLEAHVARTVPEALHETPRDIGVLLRRSHDEAEAVAVSEASEDSARELTGVLRAQLERQGVG